MVFIPFYRGGIWVTETFSIYQIVIPDGTDVSHSAWIEILTLLYMGSNSHVKGWRMVETRFLSVEIRDNQRGLVADLVRINQGGDQNDPVVVD